jgi:hypothetical protein
LGRSRPTSPEISSNKQGTTLAALQETWGQIGQEILLKCVDKVPRVLKAVVEAEGGYFDEENAPRKFKHQEVYKTLLSNLLHFAFFLM